MGVLKQMEFETSFGSLVEKHKIGAKMEKQRLFSEITFLLPMEPSLCLYSKSHK